MAAVLARDLLARLHPDLLGVDQDSVEVENDRGDHVRPSATALSACERRRAARTAAVSVAASYAP